MEVAVCWEIIIYWKRAVTVVSFYGCAAHSLSVGVFKTNHIWLILNYLGSTGTLIFYVRFRKAHFCGIMESAIVSPIA